MSDQQHREIAAILESAGRIDLLNVLLSEWATPAAEPEPTRDDLIATLEYAAGEFRRLDRPNSALAIEETLAGRGGLANLGRATTPAAEPGLDAEELIAAMRRNKHDSWVAHDSVGAESWNRGIDRAIEVVEEFAAIPAAEPGLREAYRRGWLEATSFGSEPGTDRSEPGLRGWDEDRLEAMRAFAHAVGMALTERKVPADQDAEHLTEPQMLEATAFLLDRLDDATDRWVHDRNGDLPPVSRQMQSDLRALAARLRVPASEEERR